MPRQPAPGLANGMFNMRNALMAGVPLLVTVPAKKLTIVADYAVGAAHGLDALSRIAMALDADSGPTT
jgi:thiamine pyrophosphate-dependent acetolactate synthase large subunit-like protein